MAIKIPTGAKSAVELVDQMLAVFNNRIGDITTQFDDRPRQAITSVLWLLASNYQAIFLVDDKDDVSQVLEEANKRFIYARDSNSVYWSFFCFDVPKKAAEYILNPRQILSSELQDLFDRINREKKPNKG